MKYQPKKKLNYLALKDLAIARQYGTLSADRRIQVKMPADLVDALDATFPDQDRSAVLTGLVIESLLHHHRFVDRPDLGKLVTAEQEGLDEMWEYLEEREHHAD